MMRIVLILTISLVLSSCGVFSETRSSEVTSIPTLVARVTTKPTLTETGEEQSTTTLTPNSTPTNTHTVSLPTETPSPTLTVSPPQSPTVSAEPVRSSSESEALVVDHTSISLFEQIPDEFIQAAGETTLLVQHASVGENINFGLYCLMNFFPDFPDPARRPHACDRDLAPEQIIFDEKYDRGDWDFEPRGNPGWYNKVSYFISKINALDPQNSYDVAAFIMGYVEDITILDHFFTNKDPNDNFPGLYDLETLEQAHPDTIFVWWTLALARRSEQHTVDFNQQLREYALANDKVLLDIADIESHLPDGTPCFGVDNDGNPTETIAICDEYVDEVYSGHLNAAGRLRMAKAVWVLMAQLAGWKP
jgi:hypothetical protein